MPDLRTLVASLLSKRDLSPAQWIGPERAGPFVKLATLGLAASAELDEYMRLAEGLPFRKAVAGLLEPSGCYWQVQPVRSPSTLLFRGMPSDVVGFLAGTIPIAVDPDGGAYLVADLGRGPRSAVASFLFNDHAPADATPGDFVLESTSITGLVKSGGAAGARPERAAGAALERRYRRAIWIALMVHGTRDADAVDAGELLRTVGDASPLAAYTAERKHFKSRPAVAAYWLLSHALLGQVGALTDALALARGIKHPIVVELRKVLAPLVAGTPVVERLLEKHRPEWTAADLAAIRARALGTGAPGTSTKRKS